MYTRKGPLYETICLTYDVINSEEFPNILEFYNS